MDKSSSGPQDEEWILWLKENKHRRAEIFLGKEAFLTLLKLDDRRQTLSVDVQLGRRNRMYVLDITLLSKIS